MNDLRIRKFLAALSLIAVAGLLTSTGYAQTGDQSTAPAADQTQTLEKYVVTGSYLPMSADAPIMPVTSIDAKAIDQSGNSDNLLNVLEKIAPQFSGGLNLGPTNGNIAANSTHGGSQVALRNLPTLVLINGHRAAFAPVDSVGGFEFVDLNLIPVSAVEKIEVLTDGGSAIYGSDAVGGVVNIILKSDYNGWELHSSYEWAPDLQAGHWSERTVSLTGGVSNGTTSIMIGAEWTKEDPLYQYQASNSTFTTGTSNYPGVVNIGSAYYLLNPSLNTPPSGHQSAAALLASGAYLGPYSSSYIISHYNLAHLPTSIIGDQRKSLISNFDHKITDALKFFGTIMYSNTETFSQLNAQPLSVTLSAADPTNPFNVAAKAHNRFQTNPREYNDDTTSLLGIAGLDFKISPDYALKVSVDYNVQKDNYTNQNLVDSRQLAYAESNDLLNLFAYNQAAGAVANSGIFGTAFGNFETSLYTYDALFTGKPYALPGGDIEFALGAQLRREGLGANADINSLPATFDWASGTTISPLTTARNITAVYAQVNVPIVSPAMKVPFVYSLNTSDAIRHENYQNVQNGSPTDPLFSLRYQPFDDQLTIRGTWTKAFLAPTLFELYGPGGIGFSSDLTQFQTAGGTIIGNDGQANESSGSNPALKPSFSENYTVGFVYSPKQIKGLSFTTDFYRIRYTSIVGTASDVTALQDVELNGPASPYAQFTALGNFPGQAGSTPISAKGQIAPDPSNVYFVNALVNLAGVKYEGYDVGIDYSWEWAGVGHFTFSNKDTYNVKYWVVGSPGTPAEQTAGKVSYFNGTIPKWRGYTSLEFNRGSWTAYIANTYIPALTDDDDGEHVNPYYSFDVSVSYTFSQNDPSFLALLKGMKLSVGSNDVLNRQPSNDYDVFSTDNADISTYSPLGRTVYVSATYKF
jgi:iron complex outermembrane recepter protein